MAVASRITALFMNRLIRVICVQRGDRGSDKRTARRASQLGLYLLDSAC